MIKGCACQRAISVDGLLQDYDEVYTDDVYTTGYVPAKTHYINGTVEKSSFVYANYTEIVQGVGTKFYR